MKDAAITSIIKQVKSVAPEDGLTKVATIFQMAQTPALPVVDQGRFAGLISEESVLSYVSAEGDEVASVRDLMNSNPPCANIYITIRQAAEIMNRVQAEALPVIDEFGVLYGIAFRSDVVAAMLDVIRPPTVAGMATPLGVRLTTGGVTAGAGNLGLYLAGVALMVMMELARGTIWFTMFLGDKLFHLHLLAMYASPQISRYTQLDLVHILEPLFQLLLLLIFLRFSPMSAYHAAEHQVVHAIENGEPLVPEAVSRMPRAHPRCGTNLMIAAMIFLLSSALLGSETGVVVGLVLVLTGWRRPGQFVQQYFTTKPAGPKYLENGIKVGQELMEKYRHQPYIPTSVGNRIWSMGFPQILLGFATVALIDRYIFPLIKLSSLF